ncbi:MAG: hypothetical protein LUI14_10755 [Lachnospiraceae bacterium]|nr:hypothetical protein [Lachnospiraceae bacterium]
MGIYISEKTIYKAVIWSFFLMETITLQLFGGSFRIYFIFSLLTIFILLPNVKYLNGNIIIASVAYIMALFISTIFSDSVSGAFTNTCSNILYICTAYAICLMMVAGIFEANEIQETLCNILLFIIIFGLIQYIIYYTTGISLLKGISEGQISGVSNEPNGHGKIVGMALAFSFPALVRMEPGRCKQKYKLLFTLSALTMIISIARNVLYSIIVTAIIMFCYYMPKRNVRNQLIKILFVCGVLVGVAVFLINSGVLRLGEWSTEKLQNLFITNIDDVLDDGSGSFRLPALMASIDSWLESVKTFLVGHGPGQAYALINGYYYTRVAGNGILAGLPGTGIIGEIPYVAMLILPIIYAKKLSNILNFIESDASDVSFSEQVMAIGIYVFVLDFISSAFYFAVMWTVVALGFYCETEYRRILNSEMD